jgi:octaheme c-type cytochrome (tetrathionate reductase family)
MACHEDRKQGPVNCTGCHEKRVPDHKELVRLPDNPDPIAVTKECIRCHDDAATDMLTSAHWRWRGPSPHTVGEEDRVSLGKAEGTINNFCVAVPSNWPRCTSCHAGYGWKDADFDFTDKTRMDCLVCHDTTGTYRKWPKGAGMPYPQLDLKPIAESVGKPSRKTCGDCHFQGGGGDAVKHGDMNGILYYPSRNCDVHMGGMDFQCHECHKTRNHKISGRSLSVPVAEGSRSCEDCHSAQPHNRVEKEGGGRDLLVHHLNRHTEHLHCQTCHSPVFAKCRPTKTWWDWSKAGDKKRKVNKDKYGMPDYSWKKGEFRWKESVKPEYLWYNGKVKRHLWGDPIAPEGRVTRITEPAGDIHDPTARIYPFKPMRGRQMADAVNNTLIIPHLFGPGGFWKELDWQKAFADGMAAAGLPYSGEFKWVETVMYWGLTHETMPAENALGCAQCHTSLTGEKTCNRCHQDNRHVDFKKLAARGTDFEFMKSRGRDVSELVGQTDYLDFAALGYKGDPIVHGGRFKKLPLGSVAEADEAK